MRHHYHYGHSDPLIALFIVVLVVGGLCAYLIWTNDRSNPLGRFLNGFRGYFVKNEYVEFVFTTLGFVLKNSSTSPAFAVIYADSAMDELELPQSKHKLAYQCLRQGNAMNFARLRSVIAGHRQQWENFEKRYQAFSIITGALAFDEIVTPAEEQLFRDLALAMEYDDQDTGNLWTSFLRTGFFDYDSHTGNFVAPVGSSRLFHQAGGRGDNRMNKDFDTGPRAEGAGSSGGTGDVFGSYDQDAGFQARDNSYAGASGDGQKQTAGGAYGDAGGRKQGEGRNEKKKEGFFKSFFKPSGDPELDRAYMLLHTDADASDSEVKRCYRKMMSRYHPDRAAAQGLDPEKLKEYTEISQQIQIAWDMIREKRGIR
ncbi:MAG: DnaJ domain-containing protein [Succinivibrionaceae bacterium]|nr:DnaJ domain-containing protein [Succinivibrionaceae bacterium]